MVCGRRLILLPLSIRQASASLDPLTICLGSVSATRRQGQGLYASAALATSGAQEPVFPAFERCATFAQSIHKFDILSKTVLGSFFVWWMRSLPILRL